MDVVVPRARPFVLTGGTRGVLLLHGFSGSIDTLRPLAAYLHAHGFTVLGARMAGHGATESVLEASSRSDWRRSAEEAYLLLRKTCSRIALVGDSLGALLALELSIAHPEVAAVVALNPALSPRHATRNRLVLPLVRRFMRYRSKPWVSPERRAEHLARGSSIRVPLAAYAEFLATARETRRIVSRVWVPILIVHSSADPTILPESARTLERDVSSSDKQILWISDPVHHVVDAKDPQPIYAAVLGFLSNHLGLR